MGDELVGYLRLTDKSLRRRWITDLVVKPAARRMGSPHAGLGSAIPGGATQNQGHVETAKNCAAIRLAQKLG